MNRIRPLNQTSSSITIEQRITDLDEHFSRQFVRLLLPEVAAPDEENVTRLYERWTPRDTSQELRSTFSSLSSLLAQNTWVVHPLIGSQFPRHLGTRRVRHTTSVVNHRLEPFPFGLTTDLSLCQQAFDEMYNLDSLNGSEEAVEDSGALVPDAEYRIRGDLQRKPIPYVIPLAEHEERLRSRDMAVPEDVAQHNVMYVQPAQRMVSEARTVPSAPLLNQHTGLREELYGKEEYSTNAGTRAIKTIKPTEITVTCSEFSAETFIEKASTGNFRHASDSVVKLVGPGAVDVLQVAELNQAMAQIAKSAMAQMRRVTGQRVIVQNALAARTVKRTFPVVVSALYECPVIPGDSILEKVDLVTVMVVVSLGLSREAMLTALSDPTAVVSAVPSFIVTIMSNRPGIPTLIPLRHPRAALIKGYADMGEEELEKRLAHNMLVRGVDGNIDHRDSQNATLCAANTDQWTMLTDVGKDSTLCALLLKSGLVTESELDMVQSVGARIVDIRRDRTGAILKPGQTTDWVSRRLCILKGGIEFYDLTTLRNRHGFTSGEQTTAYNVLRRLFIDYMKAGLPVGGVDLNAEVIRFMRNLWSRNLGISVQEANKVRSFGEFSDRSLIDIAGMTERVDMDDYIVRIIASWFIRMGYASSDSQRGDLMHDEVYHLPVSQRHLGAMYRFCLPYSVTEQGIAVWTALPTDAEMLIDRGALRGVFVSHTSSLRETDLTHVFDTLVHSKDKIATGSSKRIGFIYAPLLEVNVDDSEVKDVTGFVNGRFCSFRAIIHDACALIRRASPDFGNAAYFIWHPQFSILIIHNSGVFYACVGLISRPSRFVKNPKHWKESLRKHPEYDQVPIQQILPGARGRLVPG